MAEDNVPRWVRRFDNFDKAFRLLEEIVTVAANRQLNQFEQEGMIQRFEYTWELAWKTLRDYMESRGTVFTEINPLTVIREAIASKILNNDQGWLNALKDRNLMSHSYDIEKFEEVLDRIQNPHIEIIRDLHEFLQERLNV